MSYVKTVWQPGDTITAEKLNHLEGGVEEAANRPVFYPETVTGEGDVSITYKGNQIGVLSDSGTLTLNVEDTICEDDIEVEYTKPETIRNVPVSVTINSEDSVEIMLFSPLRGYFIKPDGVAAVLVNNAKMVYPYFDRRTEMFVISCVISSDTDKYDVTLNGNAVAYSNQNYIIAIESNTYPTEFNIVISDK